MRECKACKTNIGDSFSRCPICGMVQENFDGEAAFYPNSQRGKALFLWRKLLVYLLWVGTGVTVLINALLGGAPWSGYAVMGAIVVYTLFLSLETAEISLIRRIVAGSGALCLLLWWIEFATNSGPWATEIVMPLVLLAALLASATLYFAAFRRYRAQFLPIFVIIMFAFFAAGVGILPMKWPMIVLLSASCGVIISIPAAFHKALWAECKKKLHR